MHKQNNITSPSINFVNFNKEEDSLRISLEKDNSNVGLDHLFPDGTLPIHYACLYNSVKFFTNPNLPYSQINVPGGAYGSTPIMFTIYNSSYKALLFLLLNGADTSLQNAKSSDVLSLCVRFDDVLGMILILSFREEKMSIKRYLKYSLVKNSIRTWKFLSKRSKEIEFNENHKEEKENGDGLPKEDCEDTQITNNTISVVLDFKCIKSIFALITFVVLSIYSNVLRLFISSCFIFSYFAIISSPIPLIFNILYSVYAYSILISSRSSSFYVYFIIFMHSLFFFIIYFMQNSYMKINKIREAKEIITHLVLENDYDLQKFCHTCLNLKLEGNRHCSICKRCIIGYNHHCPFFNKCISKKTFIVFNLFIFFSMILFTLAVYKANLRLSKFEFLICLFVSFGSFVMFLVNFKKA